jgi:dienelactone hydrolase
VVDVNYGGSTGYGRAYRQRLNGEWGVVNLADCANAARHLVNRDEVDGRRIAIHGGSAGGYTALCALVFSDLFAACAAHYGISDLEVWARETYKFEEHMADFLVGPYPETRDRYRALTNSLRRPGVLSGHHLARTRRPNLSRFSGREHGRSAPRQGRAGRLCPIRRRAARLPAG